MLNTALIYNVGNILKSKLPVKTSITAYNWKQRAASLASSFDWHHQWIVLGVKGWVWHKMISGTETFGTSGLFALVVICHIKDQSNLSKNWYKWHACWVKETRATNGIEQWAPYTSTQFESSACHDLSPRWIELVQRQPPTCISLPSLLPTIVC